MEELLNVEVDAVAENSIHRNMKEQVINEATEL